MTTKKLKPRYLGSSSLQENQLPHELTKVPKGSVVGTTRGESLGGTDVTKKRPKSGDSASSPPAHIAAIMAKPQEAWTLDDWRLIAADLRRMHQEALDGWGKSVVELEEHAELVKRQAQLIRDLRDDQNLIFRILELPPDHSSLSPTRTIGRPRKERKWLVDAFEKMSADFRAANPKSRVTDMTVLTWHFGNSFESSGLRRSRAQNPDFKSKLKTICNALSAERNPQKRNPEK